MCRYTIKNVSAESTAMTIEEEYRDANDDSMKMMSTSTKQSLNFPCPDVSCVLMFSTEEDMMDHIATGSHTQGRSPGRQYTVNDRVKMTWVKGLSGKAEIRKTGRIVQFNPYFMTHIQRNQRTYERRTVTDISRLL